MVAVHHDPNSNKVLASLLAEIAQLLRRDGASAYRIEAPTSVLRKQSVTCRSRSRRAIGVMRRRLGRDSHDWAFDRRPDQHYFRSHRIPLLERLRGEDTAERQIASLPTVGPELARRIHQRLHIDTLPQLLAAANDGTLSQVPGIGEKRIEAIRQSLTEQTWQRNRIPHAVQLQLWDEEHSVQQVPVAELLDLDSEFRSLAANATGVTPACCLQRDQRRYRVHFSDSPRAHQLHATRDWVVIERVDLPDQERSTVVTSFSGKLHGCRVVRGREEDCYHHYRTKRSRLWKAFQWFGADSGLELTAVFGADSGLELTIRLVKLRFWLRRRRSRRSL